MISIQWYIYKYKYRQIQIQADSVVQVRTVLLTSDFGSSTRGERHNSYNANNLQRVAHLVMFKISVCRDLKNPITSSTVQIQLSTDSFSKSSNSQDHLFRAWRHLHSSPFPVWGIIMTMVIVISFAHERKTAPNDYAPEVLTRIVQSPTKLNDKILLMKIY